MRSRSRDFTAAKRLISPGFAFVPAMAEADGTSLLAETSEMAGVEMGVGKRYGSDDLHNRRFLVDPSRRAY